MSNSSGAQTSDSEDDNLPINEYISIRNGDEGEACQICKGTTAWRSMLLCGDEEGNKGCGRGFHIWCLVPKLTAIPEEDWFCPACAGGRDI